MHAVCETFLVFVILSAQQARRDYPVQPVPFTAVHVADGFWLPRMETNRKVTVWYDFRKCEETGRIDNFAKAAGQAQGPFRGIPFDDSDVYKVIEGAAYCLAIQPDPKLDKYLDDLIAKIAAAQEPDGYLYTARRLIPAEKMPGMSGPQRWSRLASSHELYNVGHLYEAAVAHWQATGKRTLLDVARKNADLLCETFGPARLREVPGHEEVEIGLVKLYRATGEDKYLQLARFFVAQRGDAAGHKLRGPGQQDHLPVLQQDEAVGHAVRAGYFYSGVADVAAMTGDEAYVKAVDRIWENVVSKKLYLTGGIGARHAGEAFGDNYELPNDSAYNETCAAIANALWNYRMFLLHGDAKYLDVFERVIYNGFLSGISLGGDLFFYPNPLACKGNYKRSPWFGCSCCPVNVVRFVPSIAGCVYATSQRSLYVNLYVGGTGRVELGGRTITLTQETRYPWEGKVRITVAPAAPDRFDLRLRIPGWAQGRPVPSDLYSYLDPAAGPCRLTVNGQAAPLALDKGFAVIARDWKPGDIVELDMPMPVRRVVAHPAVKDDIGRVAVERGPILFCAEGGDNGGQALKLVLPDAARLTSRFKPELLGGVAVVQGEGLAVRQNEEGRAVADPVAVTLVPYYAWDHRGNGEMNVWLARTKDALPMRRVLDRDRRPR